MLGEHDGAQTGKETGEGEQGAPSWSWPVHGDYQIAEGELRTRGDKPSFTYDPMTRRELPSEVYRLYDGDTDAVLRFARRYGSLGYFWLQLSHALDGPDRNLERERWIVEHAAMDECGDPLRWIWTHARTVRLVMDCLQVLKDRDGEKALALLRSLIVTEDLPDGAKRSQLRMTYADRTEQHSNVLYAGVPSDPAKALDWTRLIAEVILRPNVSVVHRWPYAATERPIKSPKLKPHVAPVRVIKSRFACPALIAAVYWHILDAAEGGTFRRCLECGKPFIVTDDRQKYCPPSQHGTGSRCANRARQRRFKKEGPPDA